MKRKLTIVIAVAALGLLPGGQQAAEGTPFTNPVPNIGGGSGT